MHTSHTALANVDLTNRCNLTCRVCFANANVAGYFYEPNIDQVRTMLETLRNERSVGGRVVQFSDGEPTIHPRFFEILTMAREMGFTHIQTATNGIELANFEFAQKAKPAGLATLYLQFDCVTDNVYRRTRGRALLKTKLKVVENCGGRPGGVCVVEVLPLRGSYCFPTHTRRSRDQLNSSRRFAAAVREKSTADPTQAVVPRLRRRRSASTFHCQLATDHWQLRYPGGHFMLRPPIRCRCKWNTDCPDFGPTLNTVR